MDKDDLIEILKEVVEINTAQLFFVLKSRENYSIKLVDLENEETQLSVADMFGEYIINNIINNDDLSLCSISTDDERENAVYLYDYDEYSDELALVNNFRIIEPDTDDPKVAFEKFNFRTDDLAKIYGFLVCYGSMEKNAVLFKKFYPISLIKRETYLLGAVKSSSRFKKIEEDDILRLNGKFELFKIRDKLFILDIKCIENNLKFKKRVEKDANALISDINNIDILENIDAIADLKDDNTTLRKLAKASKNSPILNTKKSREDIMSFIKADDKIKSKFRYTDDGTQIILDTKKSKLEFLKLLQDSFLNSGLTNILYDVKTKDAIR